MAFPPTRFTLLFLELMNRLEPKFIIIGSKESLLFNLVRFQRNYVPAIRQERNRNLMTLGGRPLGRCGLPVALYSSQLAALTEAFTDLKVREAPSAWILQQAQELIRLSLAFYNSEGEREDAIRPVIDRVFPGAKWRRRLASGSAKPEAMWDGQVFELKNERGSSGDPTAQIIADYEKIVDSVDPSKPDDVCPKSLPCSSSIPLLNLKCARLSTPTSLRWITCLR
ncbi:hypothetical protein DFH07DRAFT_411702 [Mycena maculata]|uniref:Uncharacterized protein n=1 Tax=Mycena maculata TaxID=230809 RepID=A0AAD7NIV7_9AGAR|nr:hypothetical protein DFH07DRAFT_411702 [Mycena maculata]